MQSIVINSMNELKEILTEIRSNIRCYSNLITAADKMPSIDFEPKFQEYIVKVHQLVERLPDDFCDRHSELIQLLSTHGYHFSWSRLEDQLDELVADRG